MSPENTDRNTCQRCLGLPPETKTTKRVSYNLLSIMLSSITSYQALLRVLANGGRQNLNKGVLSNK